MGVRGLGLAFTIASLVQVTLLWVTLRAKLGTLGEFSLVRSLMKITTAALPMALAIQLMKNVVGLHVNMQTFVGVFIQAAAAAFVGLAVYFGMALLLRSEEARSFALGVKRRVGIDKLPAVSAEDSVET